MTHQLRLRHRLLPYLHTMNHRAAREGAPLVQPMYWSHPRDGDAYQVPNQFAFGTELLVAPITSPKNAGTQLGSVTAWLPDGRWVDVFNALVYDGGRQVILHRDLTQIPVLAAPGAIIPLSGELVPGNSPDNPLSLEVLVVVGADGAFEMIEDDGTGTGMDPKTVARTPVSFDQQSGTVTVGPASGALGCLPASRRWTVTFLGLDLSHDPVVGGHDAPLDSDLSRESGRISISVGDLPVTDELRVTVGPNPQLVANDVSGRLFTMLDRAHIDYEAKKLIHTIATADRPLSVRISHLQALGLDRALETAVGEILLAATDPATG
jgi:Glycosyl hydrolases family 31/Domain of unknown function (DUF5110)